MGSAPQAIRATRVPGSRARPLLLVANVRASGVHGPGHVRDVAALLQERGASVRAVCTGSLEELAEVWPRDEGARVVLLGGDGSVHAAANLPATRPEVALIPAGRANNIARALGIPLAAAGAARLAVEGSPRPLDLIRAAASGATVLGVEGASAGFLALARSRYHARNSADVAAALHAGLATMARFHPLDVQVTLDGRPWALHVAQLFVANLPYFGTGLHVAPWADPRDGLLEVVALEAAGRRSIPPMLARLRRGRHVGRPGVHAWSVHRVGIATRGTSPVMVDTDDMGAGPVLLEALPGALRLVAP